MARVADAASGEARLLRLRVEGVARRLESEEAAAQAFCELTYQAFEESVVLARAFATVPFGALPEGEREFVRRRLTGGSQANLHDDVLVLTLLGSYGVEAGWRDRHSSVDHLGIPLMSQGFVDGIPMIARLLSQLGVPLERIDAGGEDDRRIVRGVIGRTLGVFYVRDAATEVDSRGRKIITAQEFVARHGIRTVFGAGGGFLDSPQHLIAVVFTRDWVEQPMVDYFVPVVNALKLAVAPLVMRGHIFAGSAG